MTATINCAFPFMFSVPPLSVTLVVLGRLLAAFVFTIPLVIVALPAQELAAPPRTVVPLENVTPALLLTLMLPDTVMVLPLDSLIVSAPPPMFPLIGVALENVIEPPVLQIWAAPEQVTAPL